MIPRRALLVAAAVLAAAALIVSLTGAAAGALAVLYGVFALVAAADAALGFRSAPPTLARSVPGSLSLARWADVRLTLGNADAGRKLRILLTDHCPQSFATAGLPQAVEIAPGRVVDVSYRLRPTRRGRFELTGTELRVASPLGLWWRRRFEPLVDVVRVYPNYGTISRQLALEVESGARLSGARLRQRRGEGTEFHQLRDYRETDSIRAIDWKASSRTSRLISREYQDERDQQVVFVVDAGRRMLAEDDELSHFDHTLNAMLLLSYVALRRGDAVGVMTLADTRRWLPPQKGAAAVNTILNHVYDTEPASHETDFLAAAAELSGRQRRRALVVVLTNLRDEQSGELAAAAELLRRRHLVFVASLRESELDASLARPVDDFDSALTYAGANRYLEARRSAHDRLRARGVFVDDCLCADLPATITSRYLAIKRAGLL